MPKGADLSSEIEKIRDVAPQARVLAAGRDLNDDEITDSISGAKDGYSETAPASELAGAIRAVHQGIIWAPRRLVAAVIAQMAESIPNAIKQRRTRLTELAGSGKITRKSPLPLGIELRTVKPMSRM